MKKLSQKLAIIFGVFSLVTLTAMLFNIVFCAFLAFISHNNIFDIMQSSLMSAITFVLWLISLILSYAYVIEEGKL